MIEICRNCGTRVYSYGSELRHSHTSSIMCDQLDPVTGNAKELELLTVVSREDAISYRNKILGGYVPSPTPKDNQPRVVEPYTKVTIIFEQPNKTTTYTIPKARDIVVEDKAILVDSEKLFSREYLTDSMDLSFNLTVDLDPEKGHLYLIEESRLGVPVED